MLFFHFLLLASAVYSTRWFSSKPDYAKWTQEELHTWLDQHNIKVPPSFDKSHLYDLVDVNLESLSSSLTGRAESGRQWSLDQYNRAQHAFQHIKDDSFDKWDESRLRAFLLELGVVAPSGPREQLVLHAKHKYRAYTDAAALYSSLACGSVSSAYAGTTEVARSASHCVSSAVAQATDEVVRAFDDTTDCVYSTWDDNRLRNWLQDNGVIEAKSAHTKDELTRLANNYYRKATSVVWESWSDSYIREWLVAHNLLKPSDTLSRSSLLGEMNKYYYRLTENVWNTWSDSELKFWLVDHHFLKSDAQKTRDELVRMVEERYLSVSDSVWGAWSDSDIRQWLSERGYLEDRSDVTNRNDLVDLINHKYPRVSENVASYLVWPDARLRAYLRERGISEKALPTSRPGLLQETRIRWVQVSARTETVLAKLKEIINSSVEAVEEKIARVLEVLSGHSRDVEHYASEKVDDAASRSSDKADEAREKAEGVGQSAQERGDGAIKRATQWVKEKVQGAGDEFNFPDSVNYDFNAFALPSKKSDSKLDMDPDPWN